MPRDLQCYSGQNAGLRGKQAPLLEADTTDDDTRDALMAKKSVLS